MGDSPMAGNGGGLVSGGAAVFRGCGKGDCWLGWECGGGEVVIWEEGIWRDRGVLVIWGGFTVCSIHRRGGGL